MRFRLTGMRREAVDFNIDQLHALLSKIQALDNDLTLLMLSTLTAPGNRGKQQSPPGQS
jgi:hypothetical protein